VALRLGCNFIGIELYDEYAEIAEKRCRQAHRIYEAKKPMTPSTATFAPPMNDRVPDEMSCDLDSEVGVLSQPAL
jgi:DNA modification methylase